MPHTAVSYRSIDADRIEIFCRKAGPRFGFPEVTHPEQIGGIVSQNGNAYEEGLGDAWRPIRHLLAVWGRYDSFFVPAGAEAFRRDIPESNMRFVNAGNFALQTDVHANALAVLEVVPAFFG